MTLDEYTMAKMYADAMERPFKDMLSIAFTRAFSSADGDGWYAILKKASEEHAKACEERDRQKAEKSGKKNGKKIEYDIAKYYNSIEDFDFQAFCKTVVFLDDYRKKLLEFYGLEDREKEIKLSFDNLKDNYRNIKSHESKNNQMPPAKYEQIMLEMKAIAEYFTSIINTKSSNSFAADLDALYSEYRESKGKRFYTFEDVFDLKKYNIDDLKNAASIFTSVSMKFGKAGFESSDLEGIKDKIANYMALQNKEESNKRESKPAPKPQPQPQLKPQPQQSSVPPVAPQPRVNTVPVQQNAFVPKKADSEKTQKIIAIVLVAVIAVLVIVFAAKLVSLIKARHQQAAPSTTVSTTVSTTQPTTTTTTQPTTTTTTKKEKVTYVEGEAELNGLKFIVEKQSVENGTINLLISNDSSITYIFSNNKFASQDVMVSKIYLNGNIDIHKKIATEYDGGYYYPKRFQPDVSDIIKVNVNDVKKLDSIKITNVCHESGHSHVFEDVTIKIKTTKE